MCLAALFRAWVATTKLLHTKRGRYHASSDEAGRFAVMLVWRRWARLSAQRAAREERCNSVPLRRRALAGAIKALRERTAALGTWRALTRPAAWQGRACALARLLVLWRLRSTLRAAAARQIELATRAERAARLTMSWSMWRSGRPRALHRWRPAVLITPAVHSSCTIHATRAPPASFGITATAKNATASLTLRCARQHDHGAEHNGGTAFDDSRLPHFTDGVVTHDDAARRGVETLLQTPCPAAASVAASSPPVRTSAGARAGTTVQRGVLIRNFGAPSHWACGARRLALSRWRWRGVRLATFSRRYVLLLQRVGLGLATRMLYAWRLRANHAASATLRERFASRSHRLLSIAATLARWRHAHRRRTTHSCAQVWCRMQLLLQETVRPPCALVTDRAQMGRLLHRWRRKLLVRRRWGEAVAICRRADVAAALKAFAARCAGSAATTAALLGSLRRRSVAFTRHWRRLTAEHRALLASACAYDAVPGARRSVRRQRRPIIGWRLGVLKRAPLRAALGRWTEVATSAATVCFSEAYARRRYLTVRSRGGLRRWASEVRARLEAIADISFARRIGQLHCRRRRVAAALGVWQRHHARAFRLHGESMAAVARLRCRALGRATSRWARVAAELALLATRRTTAAAMWQWHTLRQWRRETTAARARALLAARGGAVVRQLRRRRVTLRWRTDAAADMVRRRVSADAVHCQQRRMLAVAVETFRAYAAERRAWQVALLQRSATLAGGQLRAGWQRWLSNLLWRRGGAIGGRPEMRDAASIWRWASTTRQERARLAERALRQAARQAVGAALQLWRRMVHLGHAWALAVVQGALRPLHGAWRVWLHVRHRTTARRVFADGRRFERARAALVAWMHAAHERRLYQLAMLVGAQRGDQSREAALLWHWYLLLATRRRMHLGRRIQRETMQLRLMLLRWQEASRMSRASSAAGLLRPLHLPRPLRVHGKPPSAPAMPALQPVHTMRQPLRAWRAARGLATQAQLCGARGRLQRLVEAWDVWRRDVACKAVDREELALRRRRMLRAALRMVLHDAATCKSHAALAAACRLRAVRAAARRGLGWWRRERMVEAIARSALARMAQHAWSRFVVEANGRRACSAIGIVAAAARQRSLMTAAFEALQRFSVWRRLKRVATVRIGVLPRRHAAMRWFDANARRQVRWHIASHVLTARRLRALQPLVVALRAMAERIAARRAHGTRTMAAAVGIWVRHTIDQRRGARAAAPWATDGASFARGLLGPQAAAHGGSRRGLRRWAAAAAALRWQRARGEATAVRFLHFVQALLRQTVTSYLMVWWRAARCLARCAAMTAFARDRGATLVLLLSWRTWYAHSRVARRVVRLAARLLRCAMADALRRWVVRHLGDMVLRATDSSTKTAALRHADARGARHAVRRWRAAAVAERFERFESRCGMHNALRAWRHAMERGVSAASLVRLARGPLLRRVLAAWHARADEWRGARPRHALGRARGLTRTLVHALSRWVDWRGGSALRLGTALHVASTRRSKQLHEAWLRWYALQPLLPAAVAVAEAAVLQRACSRWLEHAGERHVAEERRRECLAARLGRGWWCLLQRGNVRRAAAQLDDSARAFHRLRVAADAFRRIVERGCRDGWRARWRAVRRGGGLATWAGYIGRGSHGLLGFIGKRGPTLLRALLRWRALRADAARHAWHMSHGALWQRRTRQIEGFRALWLSLNRALRRRVNNLAGLTWRATRLLMVALSRWHIVANAMGMPRRVIANFHAVIPAQIVAARRLLRRWAKMTCPTEPWVVRWVVLHDALVRWRGRGAVLRAFSLRYLALSQRLGHATTLRIFRCWSAVAEASRCDRPVALAAGAHGRHVRLARGFGCWLTHAALSLSASQLAVAAMRGRRSRLLRAVRRWVAFCTSAGLLVRSSLVAGVVQMFRRPGRELRDSFARWHGALSGVVPPVLRQLMRARRRLAFADMAQTSNEAAPSFETLAPIHRTPNEYVGQFQQLHDEAYRWVTVHRERGGRLAKLE